MPFITITSAQHLLVKHWTKLRTHKIYRHQQQRVIILGKKMIEDIYPYGKIIRLIVEEKKMVQYEPLFPLAVECYVTTADILKKISGTPTPEGVLAEVPIPVSPFDTIERLLVLENIADPGNVGTLIRSAHAFHWDGIFFLGNNVDPFNDKALRAGKGSTFHIPMQYGSWQELSVILQRHHMSCFVADSNGGLPLSTVATKENIALILGNESRGPSVQSKALAQRITIPMVCERDSLNVAVAGSICLYHLRRM